MRFTYFVLGFLTAAAITPMIATKELLDINAVWRKNTASARYSGCVAAKVTRKINCLKDAEDWYKNNDPTRPH